MSIRHSSITVLPQSNNNLGMTIRHSSITVLPQSNNNLGMSILPFLYKTFCITRFVFGQYRSNLPNTLLVVYVHYIATTKHINVFRLASAMFLVLGCILDTTSLRCVGRWRNCACVAHRMGHNDHLCIVVDVLWIVAQTNRVMEYICRCNLCMGCDYHTTTSRRDVENRGRLSNFGWNTMRICLGVWK